MNPSQLPASTGTLLIRFATANSAPIIAGDVFAPRTISNNFITFAGLKKWPPITLSGRSVAAAI